IAAILNGYPTWEGDPGAYWTFPSGSYDYSKVYLPLRGQFDAGSEATDCIIQSILPGSKARLTLKTNGGFCVTSAPIQSIFAGAVGYRAYDFNALLDFSLVPLECPMETIINEEVKANLTVAVQADCGRKDAGGNPVLDLRTKTVAVLENIFYLNSCLAAGTPVVRADGQRVPVESIAPGDKVQSEGGKVLTVVDVSRGAEDKPLVHLRDERGQEVRLTSTHPVVTAAGKVLPASRVKVNDRLRTRLGITRITSVTPVAYEGQVFNLKLGTEAELARLQPNEQTFFAGGFLVGDSATQVRMETDAKQPLARALPRAWKADFRNSQARAR
ncbi:Hint domain-containing protein, partial [Corallococcus llansteffanensis]